MYKLEKLQAELASQEELLKELNKTYTEEANSQSANFETNKPIMATRYLNSHIFVRRENVLSKNQYLSMLLNEIELTKAKITKINEKIEKLKIKTVISQLGKE